MIGHLKEQGIDSFDLWTPFLSKLCAAKDCLGSVQEVPSRCSDTDGKTMKDILRGFKHMPLGRGGVIFRKLNTTKEQGSTAPSNPLGAEPLAPVG